MLTLEQARNLATKYFPYHSEGLELTQEGEFWRAWTPGRTSIALLMGSDGGALYYHIAERTDAGVMEAYRNGERSEVPKPETATSHSEEEILESTQQLEESKNKLKRIIDELHPKSE